MGLYKVWERERVRKSTGKSRSAEVLAMVMLKILLEEIFGEIFTLYIIVRWCSLDEVLPFWAIWGKCNKKQWFICALRVHIFTLWMAPCLYWITPLDFEVIEI